MKGNRFFLWVLIGALALCGVMATERSAPADGPAQLSEPEPVLIIDAGHGGEDGGATTASGVKESELNLALALKLDALLGFLGQETLMIRTTDCSLHQEGDTVRERKTSDLKRRVEIVNETPGAMLLSIHQNFFTDPRYSGAQVFYTITESNRQWAETTQEMLRMVVDPENLRNAKEFPSPVYLMEHISCPAILVECGFLSNGEESSLLMTDAYQRRLVLAMAGAYLQQLYMIYD